MAAGARYDVLRTKSGDIPVTVETAPHLMLANYVDLARLKKGLRSAGVPESWFGAEIDEQFALTPDQIQTLLFGHRLHGRTPWTGEENSASITAEGVVTSSGDWSLIRNATALFRDDQLCMKYGDYVGDCLTIRRNPGGTKARENEYIWVDRKGAFPFSVVE